MWVCWLLLCSGLSHLPKELDKFDDQLAFVSTWRTDSPGQTLLIPFLSYSALQIDWGDGSPLESSNYFKSLFYGASMSHVYATPGEHTIKVIGPRIVGFSFAYEHGPRGMLYGTFPNDADKLLSIEQWGGFTLDSSSTHSFVSCHNLHTINAPDQPLIEKGAVFIYLFSGCSSLNAAFSWDLGGKVVSMEAMFSGASALNKPLMFKNAQGVQSLRWMLSGATSFNQPVVLDTGSVSDMSYAFYSAHVFNQPLAWDTSNVRSMVRMFFNATNFNQKLDFNTSNVYDMTGMFSQATSFDQPLFFDTSRVLYMDDMFYGATVFNQNLPFDTASVKNMYSMFSHSLISVSYAAWDTRNVSICSEFCHHCGLPKFPLCNPCEMPSEKKSALTTANGLRVCNYPLSPIVVARSFAEL